MLERSDSAAPPQADRKPTASVRHGVTLTDEFAWLRADNWQ